MDNNIYILQAEVGEYGFEIIKVFATRELAESFLETATSEDLNYNSHGACEIYEHEY